MTSPTIVPADIPWQEVGYDDNLRCRLLATITVAGVDMHLEALEVTTDEFGVHEAVYSERTSLIRDLEDHEGTAFQTVEIEGREYILYAVPHGR